MGENVIISSSPPSANEWHTCCTESTVLISTVRPSRVGDDGGRKCHMAAVRKKKENTLPKKKTAAVADHQKA